MKRFFQLLIATAITATAILPTTLFAADATPSTNVTPDERAKIETVVKQYLSQNPEVVIEAIQSFQKKQYEQAEKSVKETQLDAPKYVKELFQQNGDPMIGNPKGTITVVEFFDYQCPHCVRMVPTIDAIVKANPNVRFVFKDWPIRGAVSDFAAKAALAANMQGGKYFQMHEAILKSKQQPLTEEGILNLAKALGLNIDKLKKDMNDPSIAKQLEANTQLAQSLKLFGTPAFFIGQTNLASGGKLNYVPGEVTQSQLQDIINKTK